MLLTLRHAVRKALRRTGFDLVRFTPAPGPRVALQKAYPDFAEEHLETILQVLPYTLTSPERLYVLIEAAKYICARSIEGAIVECGVWKGGSMMAVARTLAALHSTERDLHLFDTYDGMTPPTDADNLWDGRSAAAVLSMSSKADPHSYWSAAPLDGVKEVMSRTRYPSERIHYVVGRVEDTIPEQAPKRIALLRLDTDFYESTRHELHYLFPRLIRGGVLIIDDYGHWTGARKAVDEYLSQVHGIGPLCRVDYTGRIAVKL